MVRPAHPGLVLPRLRPQDPGAGTRGEEPAARPPAARAQDVLASGGAGAAFAALAALSGPDPDEDGAPGEGSAPAEGGLPPASGSSPPPPRSAPEEGNHP